jgi:xanthine dehydrogenase YagR molybdenum-binding subunit
MPNYNWPPQDKRSVIGKRISRTDGFAKSSGKAKYGSDINRPNMLQAVFLTCPHAHARITSIDTSAAEKSQGVAALEMVLQQGTEVQWQGAEILAIAADTEEHARDAVRKVKVNYEVMPHLVKEEDLAKVGNRAKPAGEQVKGDPDAGFQEADAVAEGTYGIPVITHCCLEPHGQVIEWRGDKVEFWPTTQNISGISGDLAKSLGIPVSNIHAQQEAMGGGFGSKFSSDLWGTVGGNLSKKAGGRPVKLFLDRATELLVAGNRPSAFAKVRIAAKKDGSITAWSSESWATGGFGGGGMPPIPYVFTELPHRRMNHSAISTNTGGSRAWRAPNHQQACYLTQAAMDDLAAKLGMDSAEFFKVNAKYTARPEVYRSQIDKGMELIEWKKLWHPRGQGSGPVKRGLGLAMHTWGGAGHAAQARAIVNPDGSVEIEIGSQDLGTGTRTIIAQVAAETFGLRVNDVKVKLGDNSYPPAGASGGSTTVGGVSSATRKATVDALDKIFARVAPGLGATSEDLEAVDGMIRVKGSPSKSMTWKAACQKLGVERISEMGENNPRNPMGLNTGGVGGVQLADVSVDTETGVVTLNKLVAVQDAGLWINPKTADSQIYGACIMSICAALYEERIMDATTGRMLNADMEFYKLAGIKDIGEIVIHLNMESEHDQRGVIGLGEPPAIGGIAAIANAVANAIGVRVPMVPLTPDRVLAALNGRSA